MHRGTILPFQFAIRARTVCLGQLFQRFGIVCVLVLFVRLVSTCVQHSDALPVLSGGFVLQHNGPHHCVRLPTGEFLRWQQHQSIAVSVWHFWEHIGPFFAIVFWAMRIWLFLCGRFHIIPRIPVPGRAIVPGAQRFVWGCLRHL